MTPRIYTDEYFARQKRIAEAKFAATKAMENITPQLDTVEWIAVFTAMIQRMVDYEMSEEGAK